MDDQTQKLQALTEIAEIISRADGLEGLLEDALSEMRRTFNAVAGGILLLDGEGDDLSGAAQVGMDLQVASAVFELMTGKDILEQIVLKEQPYVDRDLMVSGWAELARRHGFSSLAAVPLVSMMRTVGLLFGLWASGGGPDDRDLQLLGTIGRQVGMGVDYLWLYDNSRRRGEQFRVVSEIGQQITSVLNIDEILVQVVQLIHDAFDYYHVGIALIEADDAVYRVGAGELWENSEFQFKPARLKVGSEGITGWVAASGEPLLVSDVSREERYVWMEGSRTSSELAVPIAVKGQVLGVLDVQSTQMNAFDGSDLTMLQSLADQVAVALENARLYQQAQQSAVWEERQRLARELHDSAAQSLYGVTLYSEAASRHLAAGEVDLVADHLHELKQTAQEALREMRLLVFELRPSVLDKVGLATALQMRLEAVEQRAGLETNLKVEVHRRLSPEVEEGLYRIAQEALNNALKHAQAHKVNVSLVQEDQLLVLEIADDGSGYSVDAAAKGGGMGLKGMAERAAQMGGSLTVDSAPGRGTRVRVEVIQ